MNRRPRWSVASALVVAALAAGVVVVVRHDDGNGCAYDTKVTAISHLQSPARMKQEHDQRLDKLVTAVGAMGPPFGPVRAGLGYGILNYLHLYPAGDGILAFEKNYAPVTYLDGRTLKPRWSLKPGSKRSTFDVAPDRYLIFDLESRRTPVSSYDLATGRSLWCTTLPLAVHANDPFTTTVVDGGDVVTAMKHGSAIQLSRLSGSSGELRWRRDLPGADRGDFLAQLDASTLLVGGREEFLIGDVQGEPARPATALSAVALSDGKPKWTYDPGPRAVAHVVGVADGHPILLVSRPSGLSLVALSSTGREFWHRTPSAYPTSGATLRHGVVITWSRTGRLQVSAPDFGQTTVLHGYDAATGEPRWSRPLNPPRSSLLPGFPLDAMPSLDSDQVLVPTGRGVSVLDVRTGTSAGYLLPASGDDPVTGGTSSYEPYQLLVTDRLLGIMTQNGSVIAQRADAAE